MTSDDLLEGGVNGGVNPKLTHVVPNFPSASLAICPAPGAAFLDHHEY
jgi:hypothetical protein